MNASKEECRKAIGCVQQAEKAIGDNWFDDHGALAFVREFLKVAEKKLPSEEAIAKDKERKKSPKHKSPPGTRILKGGLT